MTSSINSLNDLFRQLSQQGSAQGATGPGAAGAAQFLQGAGQDLPPPPPLDGSGDAAPTQAPSATASQLPSQKFSADVLQTLLSAQTSQSSQPTASDLANALIKGLDQNGDGSLSLSEVQQALQGSTGQTSQTNASTSNDPLAQAFAALDTNGDGQLSASELAAGLEKLAQDQSASASTAPHHHHHHHPAEAAQQPDSPAAATSASTASTDTAPSPAPATTSGATPSTGDIAANLVAAVTISSTAAAA